MIKISDVVKEIVSTSDVASAALSQGILNYSAYADTIHEEVEERAMKPVKKGTIVVALSRLVSNANIESIVPTVVIDDLTVKAPLIEFVIPKTKRHLETIQNIYRSELFASGEFMTVTQGVTEITVIVSEKFKSEIQSCFNSNELTATISNLVALNVSFNERYVQEPNIIFAIIKTLAEKRINIIEIVSTYTELTFILQKKDMQKALLRLSEVYQKS
jgi:aspartokinase